VSSALPPKPPRSVPPPLPRRSAPPPAPAVEPPAPAVEPPAPTIDDLPKPPEAEVDDSGARYAAKEGDTVRGVDVHVVVSAAGVASPVQLPFQGKLERELSGDVLIEDRPVAVVGSIAKNEVEHVPPEGSFQKPPKNEGKVIVGSSTVFANDKAVARAGDLVETCSDPKDLPSSVVLCKSTVLVGS
jgi:uncharacterized Zn-binding protein involved in type VI secretion